MKRRNKQELFLNSEPQEVGDADDDFFYEESGPGCTADGIPLNDAGIECGLEGCALSDEEKEVFCRWH